MGGCNYVIPLTINHLSATAGRQRPPAKPKLGRRHGIGGRNRQRSTGRIALSGEGRDMRPVLGTDLDEGARQLVMVTQDPPYRRQGVPQLRRAMVIDRPADQGRHDPGGIDDRSESQ